MKYNQTHHISSFEKREILSIAETADLLRVSESKLYHMTSSNEIPFYKMGSRVLFKRADVMTWFEQFNQKAL